MAAVSNLELEARGDSESSQEDISMMLNGRLGPGGAGYFVDVPYRHLMLVGLGSPVVGLLFCLGYSLAYKYEEVNRTHCNVPNVIPSISSTVGQYSPQIYVWRTAVCFMIGQRALDILAYHRFYATPAVLRRRLLRGVNWVSTLLMAAEYAGLMLLSYVSTIENHAVHVLGFNIFITSAMLHMVAATYMFAKSRRRDQMAPSELLSYRWKRTTTALCYCVFAFALYFYWRHNKYCEPYMYSFFCALEWSTVMINIAFHFSAWVDFAPCDFVLGPSPHSAPDKPWSCP